jgi:hypothetical protein
VEGFDLGWNPFLGAGQPLYLFSNFFHYLVSEFFIQYSKIFDLEVSGNQLNNLVFISGHYYASVGLVLLLRLLVSNAVLTLFGMSAFLFGGLFYNNIVQHYATQIVYPIVYSLFFLIHFLKYRRVSSLFLFFLFFGGFANNYIPVYFGVPLVLFFLSWSVAQPTSGLSLRQWLPAIRKKIFAIPLLSKIPQLVLCGIIFLITAGPLIFLYLEMGDYVSPSRGFNEAGDVNTQGYGTQGSVNAPLTGYKILYEKKGDPGRGGIPFHHTSFIGIPAFLFVGLPFFLLLQRRKNENSFAGHRGFWSRVFAIALVAVMILGAGKDSSFWIVYVDYFPFGSAIRHSAGFAAIATVFIIILSVCGFHLFLNRHIPFFQKLLSLGFGLIFLMFADLNALDAGVTVVSGLGLLITLFIVHGKKSNQSARNFIPLFFLLVLCVDLGVYTFKYTSLGFCELREEPPKKFVYPHVWKSECDSCPDPIPFNLHPIRDKEIIWSHPKDDFMFLLQKDFGTFLKDVARPVGFLKGDLLYILRNKDDWDPTQLKTIPDPTSSFLKLQLPSVGEIEWSEVVSPNRIEIVVSAQNPAWLLRMENFHKSWKAFVDGIEVEIEKVKPNFQMIWLPSGRHRVEFIFASNYTKIRNASLFTVTAGWIFMLIWMGKNGAGVISIRGRGRLNENQCVWMLNAILGALLIYLWFI